MEKNLVELVSDNGFFRRKDNKQKVLVIPMGPPKLITFSGEGDFSYSGIRMWTSEKEDYVPDFNDREKREIKKGGGLVPIGLMTRWDGKKTWEVLILKSYFDREVLEHSLPKADSFILSKDIDIQKRDGEYCYLKGIQYCQFKR